MGCQTAQPDPYKSDIWIGISSTSSKSLLQNSFSPQEFIEKHCAQVSLFDAPHFNPILSWKGRKQDYFVEIIAYHYFQEISCCKESPRLLFVYTERIFKLDEPKQNPELSPEQQLAIWKDILTGLQNLQRRIGVYFGLKKGMVGYNQELKGRVWFHENYASPSVEVIRSLPCKSYWEEEVIKSLLEVCQSHPNAIFAGLTELIKLKGICLFRDIFLIDARRDSLKTQIDALKRHAVKIRPQADIPSLKNSIEAYQDCPQRERKKTLAASSHIFSRNSSMTVQAPDIGSLSDVASSLHPSPPRSSLKPKGSSSLDYSNLRIRLGSKRGNCSFEGLPCSKPGKMKMGLENIVEEDSGPGITLVQSVIMFEKLEQEESNLMEQESVERSMEALFPLAI